MSGPQAIAKMLIDLLYNKPKGGVTVSNRYGEATDHFLEANPVVSTAIDSSLLSPVASDICHPEIYIAIDFTHQFVESVVPNSDYKPLIGKRPLDPALMQRYADKIFIFVQRYFEYVQSPAGVKSGATFDFSANITADYEKNPRDENVINVFLNKIINYFLTSINVRRARNDIGTASVVLKDIKNPSDDGTGNFRLFYDATYAILDQLFVPMLPITIWGKGRLYRNWYFPIFDGYITSNSFKDANGFVEYNIECKDVLELARVSIDMISPSVVQLAEERKVDSINILVKPFYGHDHFTIVDRLFRGGLIVFDPTGRSESDKNKYDYAYSRSYDIMKPPPLEPYAPETLSPKEALPLYSLGRFEPAFMNDPDDQSYGYKRESALEAIAVPKEKFTTDFAVKYVSHRERTRSLIAWGDSITPYRVWETQSPDIYTSTFSSRLDILTEVAKTVYYDFFVDGCGNVHYQPMRLNNEFLLGDALYPKLVETPEGSSYYHPRKFKHAQVINPREVFSNSSLINIEELITFLRVSGQHSIIRDVAPENLNLIGCATHKPLISRFGYRRGEEHNVLFNENPKITDSLHFLDVAAMVFMVFKNAELYTRETTIVFRPELEIAAPVLYTEDNNVFYVNSISHNVTIGGDATTNVSCSMGRKDYQLPPDLNSFLVATEEAYNINAFDPQALYSKLKAYEWVEYINQEDINLLEFYEEHGRPEEKIVSSGNVEYFYDEEDDF